MSFDMQKIREDFPILKRKINGKELIYLDNAATTQKPKQVIRAIADYYQKHNANVHRGIYSLSEEAGQMYEKARAVTAGFMGVETDELIFVRNTTEAINLAAFAWGWFNLKKGDEVLTTVMEHHSNLLPWKRLEVLKGVKVRVAEVDEEARLNMKDLKKKISKKTKLIAVSYLSNTTGVINPIKKIVKLAESAGAKVLVDGAQSMGHFKVEVKKLGVDFLAFSGHKMMAGMGIGGLYIKRQAQEEMEPFLVGGGMINKVGLKKTVWAKGVEKWEAGTPNVAGAVGLAEAVKYLQKLGMKEIKNHEQKLTEYGLKKLKQIKELKLAGPENMDNRGGVIAFNIQGIDSHDAAVVLDNEGVAVRSGWHCCQPLHQRMGWQPTVRVSFYVYNTFKEVDKLVEGLKKVIRFGTL